MSSTLAAAPQPRPQAERPPTLTPSPLRRALVHFDAGERAAVRLAAADALARRLDMTVTALYATTPTAMAAGAAGAIDGGTGVFAAALALDDERRACAHERFEALRPGPHVRWDALDALAVTPDFVRAAWLHDLVVVGQYDPQDPQGRVVPADFAESVALTSGRPTLVVPRTGDVGAGLGRCALVGWKRAREAAVALTAALPLLHAAQRVHVALPAGERSVIEPWLLRHDIDAQFHEGPDDALAGERLLSCAAEVGADLLVMGCYGHGRLRELVLGGASRTVLERAHLPVLMAH